MRTVMMSIRMESDDANCSKTESLTCKTDALRDTSAIPARKPTAIPVRSPNLALQVPWCTRSAFGFFRARLPRLDAAAAVFKARPSIRTLFATF